MPTTPQAQPLQQRTFDALWSADIFTRYRQIMADLSKGVLTITLPKSVAAQTSEKKVEIKAAA